MKNNKRPFLFKPEQDETIEQFKARVKKILRLRPPTAEQEKRKKGLGEN